MNPMSRRTMLAATAAGGALTASTTLAQGAGQGDVPQPIRGNTGGTDPGPRNAAADRDNPDLLAPPPTDAGDIPNLKWPFSLSHNRLQDGGWARQVTVRELPVSKAMAGVDMRLNPGGIRELHWHKADEWSLMLNGSARITCIDENGRNFIADVKQGDLWYFSSGLPHSIQALQDGCEFLLVFDDGDFSEDNTFLISQWFAHLPKPVLAKNFNEPESAFANIPQKQLYIFAAPVPPSLQADTVADPNGPVPNPFVFRMMDMQPVKCPGGSVRIVDSQVFKASARIAAAFVEIEPGGMRELHWHPLADEWQYYISGRARMTVFASGNNSRTFDYQAGDVGYVPRAMGHYIENTGDAPVRYLEMFVAPRYTDVSLAQWLALIPPELVKQHLHLSDTVIGRLQKQKQLVVGSSQSATSPPAQPG
ncbi:oxalate decarboxylase family bicupin [Rhodopila sp.]|uniref:oxalate decarboxylase family bicupin n=1 Tax=Rhodopila sp. TaxID=2480087 RepID=UPI003D138E5F